MALPKYNRRDFYDKVTINGIIELDLLSFRWVQFAQFIGNNKTQIHIVKKHEEGKLWLISVQYYDTETLDWLIALINGIMDPINGVIVGMELSIPRIADIEQFYQSVRASSRKQTEVLIPKTTI